MSGASERANGRARGPVLTSVFLAVLGAATVVVSMGDRFSLPQWRPVRAGLFFLLAISGIIPAAHYSLLEGVVRAFTVSPRIKE